MPEISDEQLAQFQKATAFLQEAATKPETRRAFESLAKKLRPDIETSEDIAEAYAAPIREELLAHTKKIDEFLSAQQDAAKTAAEAAADRQRDDAFSRLRADGYTDDGLEKIRSLMVERNIPDPEAAAALFDRMNPKPVEGSSSWEPANWDIKTNAVERDVEGLFSDSEAWADREVYNVLKDMRSGNGS